MRFADVSLLAQGSAQAADHAMCSRFRLCRASQASILKPGSYSLSSSARHESPMHPNLQPEFFPERLAALEAIEELVEEADHNCIDADAYRFGPLFELVAGLCADVEKLRV